jgi:hypothetical protein
MATAQPANSLTIETPHGYREFRLLCGDVAAQPAHLVVLSVHAGAGRPGGNVLSALEERWGTLDLDAAALVLSLTRHSPFRLTPAPGAPESPAGVYLFTPPAGFPFADLLMLRLPGARQFGDDFTAAEAYRRAVRGAFAAVAALEFHGKNYPTIALPVFGGRRKFPKLEAMTNLLATAVDWLNVSRHTERILFTVFEEEEVGDWSQAMDQALGRTFDDGDYRDAAAELRARLTEQVGVVLAAESESGLGRILRDLRDALGKEVSIQQFGMLGRLLAEAVSARLCSDLGIKPSNNAFANIEKLGESPRVSRWIHSYLHCLRVLGNEAVHLMDREDRLPEALAAGDLVVIFGNMVRVIDFHKLWRSRNGRAKARPSAEAK